MQEDKVCAKKQGFFAKHVAFKTLVDKINNTLLFDVCLTLYTKTFARKKEGGGYTTKERLAQLRCANRNDRI